MPLRHISLDQITEADLVKLKDNAVPESATVDYKVAMMGNSDKDKLDFVRDVASFANGQGGDIIFGIEEEAGVPVDVAGLFDVDPDAETLRLQSMIVSVIQPIIFGVDISPPIRFESGAVALIVRIPGSWSGPHLVTRQNENRFWIRRAGGKGMMTVDEIRQGFLKGQEVAERAREFRQERLDQFRLNHQYGLTPIKLSDQGRLAVHLVPFESFSPGYSVDLSQIHPETGFQISPMGSGGHSWRFNSNGFLFFRPELEASNNPTYVQFYRSGQVEAVLSGLWEADGPKRVLGGVIDPTVAGKIMTYLIALFEKLNVRPPIAVFISLLNCRDALLDNGVNYGIGEEHRIDSDTVAPPEIIIDKPFEDKSALMRSLKPALDALWNSGGWPGSPNFTEDGRYRL